MQLEQLGPYKIGRKLGRGGMGTVYAGTLAETGEPAAIKILAASLAHDDGFRERFKTEIETLRKLEHPNIVRLYGFGEQDDLLFYAMELVDGRSLEDEIQAGRRFDWREVTEYGIQICRALKHAHDRGVIHRDIKPANLLLTPDDRIKLSDFGIAKLFGATGLTSAGGVLGTAEYMAPEQADGRPITHRCDLYSLGGLLYTLLARRPPFRAPSLVEMLQLQRFAAPDPVSRYAADVPQELESIIAQCLEKDPDRRIPTAMVLSRRLESMRHGLSLRGDPLAGLSPTRPGDAPDVSVSSPTMPAPAAPPLQPAAESSAEAPRESQEYDLAPAVSPSEKTAAGRHERALSQTVDMVSATTPVGAAGASAGLVPAAMPPVEPAGSQSSATGTTASTGRFVSVAEEERRRRAAARDDSEPWVSPQTLALLAAVALLAVGTWWLMQPPSADALYDRISAAEGENALSDALPDIQRFLTAYPHDPRIEVVRGYQEEVELYRKQLQAARRGQSLAGIETASPVERAYLEAMNDARVSPERAAEKLAAILDLYGSDEKLAKSAEEPLKLARRQLAAIRQQIESQAAASLKLLGARLDEADRLGPRDPAAARSIRRAVIELYRDKPWATAAVERAQAALAQHAAVESVPTP